MGERGGVKLSANRLTDRERQRQTKTDQGSHRNKRTAIGRHRQTSVDKGDTDRHRQAHTATDRHRAGALRHSVPTRQIPSIALGIDIPNLNT